MRARFIAALVVAVVFWIAASTAEAMPKVRYLELQAMTQGERLREQFVDGKVHALAILVGIRPDTWAAKNHCVSTVFNILDTNIDWDAYAEETEFHTYGITDNTYIRYASSIYRERC